MSRNYDGRRTSTRSLTRTGGAEVAGTCAHDAAPRKAWVVSACKLEIMEVRLCPVFSVLIIIRARLPPSALVFSASSLSLPMTYADHPPPQLVEQFEDDPLEFIRLDLALPGTDASADEC
ncbi:hypothetical protein FIBSPDRAFT_954960 [Athelia psychrophila]|uniref:Uncharacterized protein n=1 Tax=Athelia psychrophila TaxID=1759441 RepID=A0A166IJI8_9AGAM|nr:hypothetical protein FIBSPDRAFT_954960 [Fibularhizoctonia sp. CBS 109695]